MSRKTMEFSFAIGGKVDGSLRNAFRTATSSMSDLKQQARQTQRALDALGNDFRRGKIHQSQYAEETAKLTRNLKRLEAVQARQKAFKAGVSRAASTTKTVAGIAAVGTAAAATHVALDSLNKAGSFESEITKAAIKAGASKAEFKALSDEALYLGAATSLSASEVAKAMDEMAAKGFNSKGIIASMPGIIAGAESSGEDLALTADTVVSALNAFNLPASDASRVADIMATSANASAAGIGDLGYSFKYAAPYAKTLGISIEELSAVTGLLVDKGFAGEQAGTALRMAMKRLSSPPKAAAKALGQLNMSALDSKGKFKTLAQITTDWNKATKNLTETQKVQYAATVFGTEASSAMLSLFESGPQKIRKTTKALEESEGSAQKAAKAMKDNYAGAKEQFFGALESAQIKFATPILPVVKDIFQGLTGDIEGNLNTVEKLGQKVADKLKVIFEPFATKKPKLTPEIKADPDAMAKYQEELAKYTNFKKMDFGDKIVYALDESSKAMETWLNGSGGESMSKIFNKLGEIAAKAWLNAFKTTVKSSFGNLMEGNFSAAAGTGAAAWMLGGGALVKGGYKVGKAGYNKVKGRRTLGGEAVKTASKTNPKVVAAPKATPQYSSVLRKNVVPVEATKAAPKVTKAPNVLKTMGGTLSKTFAPVSKVLGKVATPLAVAGELIHFAKAKDKVKAGTESAGGLAGGLGGAKIGAAIGTAIAPGIGTVLGGLVGGAGGYMAGKWLGGKAVDKARGTSEATTVASPTPTSNATQSAGTNVNTQALQTSINLTANNFNVLAGYVGQASGWVVGGFNTMQSSSNMVNSNLNVLTSYVGQASGWVVGSFNGMQSSGSVVVGNLNILASYVGMASGWIASLNGIQGAAQRVIGALGNLEARINSIQLPSVKSKRVSFSG